jgi:hypothetical protein
MSLGEAVPLLRRRLAASSLRTVLVEAGRVSADQPEKKSECRLWVISGSADHVDGLARTRPVYLRVSGLVPRQPRGVGLGPGADVEGIDTSIQVDVLLRNKVRLA